MRSFILGILTFCVLLSGPARAEDSESLLIDKSLIVLEELQAMPDLAAPDWLLQRAEGIAILPEVIKAGAIVGGRGGSGVLLVRRQDGSWSNPLFIGLGAASFGWQFGVQAADVILVFTTRRSVEGITDGKLTLGADAAAVAGPVGRWAPAATNVTLDAEVYSYSRAKGLFAGLSLEGSVIAIRDGANERFYGRDGVIPSDIIAPTAPLAPSPAPALMEAVSRLSGTSSEPQMAPPAGETETPPAVEPTPSEGAQSFPMEDPAPGAEPG